jgi:hypothetical protein
LSVKLGHGERSVAVHAVDVPAVAVADPAVAGGDEPAVVAKGDDLIPDTDGRVTNRAAVGGDLSLLHA